MEDCSETAACVAVAVAVAVGLVAMIGVTEGLTVGETVIWTVGWTVAFAEAFFFFLWCLTDEEGVVEGVGPLMVGVEDEFCALPTETSAKMNNATQNIIFFFMETNSLTFFEIHQMH